MKLKVKLGRRQVVLLVAAVLVIGALLAGRAADEPPATGLDDAADRACSDFAAGNPRARTRAARLALADRVAPSARRTGNTTIEQRAAELGRRATGTAADWKAGADALTGACRDAGWTAR